MKREKFTILESTCVPLPLANIDTDQIIPARFLNSVTREGFGKNLFRDWRYDKEGRQRYPVSSPRDLPGFSSVTLSISGCRYWRARMPLIAPTAEMSSRLI